MDTLIAKIRELDMVTLSAPDTLTLVQELRPTRDEAELHCTKSDCPGPGNEFEITESVRICKSCGDTVPLEADIVVQAEEIDASRQVPDKPINPDINWLKTMNSKNPASRQFPDDVIADAAKLYSYLPSYHIIRRGGVREGILAVCVYRVMESRGMPVKPETIMKSLSINADAFSKGVQELEVMDQNHGLDDAYSRGLIKRMDSVKMTSITHSQASLERLMEGINLQQACQASNLDYQKVREFCFKLLKFCYDFGVSDNSRPQNIPPGIIGLLNHHLPLKINRKIIQDSSDTSKSTFGRVKKELQIILESSSHPLHRKLIHLCHKYEIIKRGQEPKPSRNSRTKPAKAWPDVTIRSTSSASKEEQPIYPDIVREPSLAEDILEPID